MSAEKPCAHGGELVAKYDGGRIPLLCKECYLIVGYMPTGWMPVRAAAQVWDKGYVSGYAFGWESAQDTYDGPAEDPTENPYADLL